MIWYVSFEAAVAVETKFGVDGIDNGGQTSIPPTNAIISPAGKGDYRLFSPVPASH